MRRLTSGGLRPGGPKRWRSDAGAQPVAFLPLGSHFRGEKGAFKAKCLAKNGSIYNGFSGLAWSDPGCTVRDARLVLTDSGGIQEETTALGVPCITLRNNTERPITAAEGTNVVVGQDPQRILESVHDVLQTGGKAGRIPEFWDGSAASRIAGVLREVYGKG